MSCKISAANCRKGALHTHTLWSDGRSLPEVVLKSFQDSGFDFVCLSDHNILPEDEHVWLRIAAAEGPWPPDLARQEFLRSEELLGSGVLEKKQISYRTFIRLKTFAELQRDWQIPGKFLVIPGEEITTIHRNFGTADRHYSLHANIFNCGRNIPEPRRDDRTGKELLGDMLQSFREQELPGAFFMVDHPFYQVWDIAPEMLIDFPEIKVFEICNSGTGDMPDNWIYERERYWDFILAHRLANGSGIIYGTATDDAHFYDPERIHTPAAYNSGFVIVNCPGEFTAEAIGKAILNGEFYSSCGVELAEITFENNTLNIKVKPDGDEKYRIDFISTPLDFDRQMNYREFVHPAKAEFNRTLPEMPDSVGITVKSVKGCEGSYTLSGKDMYVRAVVTGSRDSQLAGTPFHPAKRTAWSQPFLPEN